MTPKPTFGSLCGTGAGGYARKAEEAEDPFTGPPGKMLECVRIAVTLGNSYRQTCWH
jgi:hypothetical protein